MIEIFPFLPPHECERPYTVSQINEGIAFALESENTLVWAEAEISNFKCASSGHFYFRLKDNNSQIPAVMWRSTAAKHPFEPEDGMAVTVIASVRVYRKGGYYQLDVHKMHSIGVGALFAAFEKLRGKLKEEGLFDPEYKKPLPETVERLGVITAKTGAAIRDIIKVVSKRAPQTDILLRSTPVQGNEAPLEIVAAIKEINEYAQCDCIILGRGGGSVEDLWAFNDERVVRAIFASETPIISAVGHEIDFTLSDFVADVRAPTPSAAAEIAVADERENRRYFEEITKRFSSLMQYYFTSIYDAYKVTVQHPVFKKALYLVSEARQQCDMINERSIRAIVYIVKNYKAQLSKHAAQLQALSPLAVLSRGYSAVSKEDCTLVKDSSQLQKGENIHIQFYKGKATADVISVDK
ncbi:exodeoxyribonuclease VII large subunit [Fibrobacterota bacterium]